MVYLSCGYLVNFSFTLSRSYTQLSRKFRKTFDARDIPRWPSAGRRARRPGAARARRASIFPPTQKEARVGAWVCSLVTCKLSQTLGHAYVGDRKPKARCAVSLLTVAEFRPSFGGSGGYVWFAGCVGPYAMYGACGRVVVVARVCCEGGEYMSTLKARFGYF